MLVSVLVAVFVAGGVLGALVMLVLGVQAEERRMSVKAKRRAATRVESGTRRVLGVSVRDQVGSADRSDHDGVGR
jgi:membrane protein YqaA with SNARE-associated domain